MTINTEDLLNSIIASLGRIDYVRSKDIPNIELYMDQVTTFMEEQFVRTRRYPDDKVLTKTMINNYAKNDLLPPPIKKKYNKEHIVLLIFIYYFKNILSIKDIDTLLNPLIEKYFGKDEEFGLQEIYEEICRNEKLKISDTQADVKNLYEKTEQYFENVPEEDRETLQLFAFICSLSFDVYVKKQIIEKLIDGMNDTKK